MRSALRIGITGHRLDKLEPGNPGRLRARLAELLTALDAAWHRIGPSEAPRLVSGLAEGADRLAVEAAPCDWRLDVLLPFPRDEYRRDFLRDGEETSPSSLAFDAHLATAATVREPDVADPDREAAYAVLGRRLVRDVDCLVAVWDGLAPRGPGGTAAVLTEAVSLGLPVLWVDPRGEAPMRLVTGFAAGEVMRPLTQEADAATIEAVVANTRAADCRSRSKPSSC